MSDFARLILENGMVFNGKSFGAASEVTGEVVFTTGMTGYLETLTDQSYYGQIVLQTFPLIGNYGIIPSDFESDSVGASAYIVKHPCSYPSNFRSVETLDTFLREKKIVGLCDIDTRAVTKIIRNLGVMNGRITNKIDEDIKLSEIVSHKITGSVENVSVKGIKVFRTDRAKYKIAVLDFGLKQNIVRELIKRRCDVWVFPHNSRLSNLLTINPDGIVLSNGPGNPLDNTAVIENLKEIADSKIPIFGICLGHQLLALANGFQTHKLKYGHRGTNQPVKDLSDGRIYISSQNHGYAVVSESIDGDSASEWFTNANDNSCEGILYKKIPAMSVQFHPEGCAGPFDTVFLFDKFIEKAGNYKCH